jgi:uncharacterized protein YydD (DUF2326 family)
MAPSLKGWTFFVEIDLRGKRYTISRNTSDPKRVFLEGDFSDWLVKPKLHKETGAMVMSNSDWCDILGWLAFDLPRYEDNRRYHASFRTMITYFVRRGRSAFSDPFVHEPKQKEWDKQINNAYLLGLNTDHVSQAQEIRDRENTFKELKKASQAGTFPELMGTLGQLETDKVRLEQKVERTSDQLRTFRVHPQYRNLEVFTLRTVKESVSVIKGNIGTWLNGECPLRGYYSFVNLVICELDQQLICRFNCVRLSHWLILCDQSSCSQLAIGDQYNH